MNDIPKSVKTFVKPDSFATIVCPACRAVKNIGVLKFKDKKHAVRVKCGCGHTFEVQLEFRLHYRKETNLDGTYDIKPPAVGGGKTKIVNLSIRGACFEVKGKHSLEPGQAGSLVFTLDDKKETVLIKNVIIKSVKGSRIGCEFVDDKAFEKELGFYMMP